jgi:integrase
MKLTQATVAKIKLPAGKSDHIEWDDSLPGFGLRVRDSGSKNWIVQYKIGSQHRRVTLGSAAELTADQARNGWEGSDNVKRLGAAIILANAGHGVDYANDRAERRVAAGQTFGKAVPAFLAYQAPRVAPSYLDAVTRYMNQHWKPLHGLALASISRGVVAAELRTIEKERGPIACDRARAALSKFFAWGMGEGVCDVNPVVGTNKAEDEYEAEARALTDAELVALWKTAPDSDYGKIVRLLFLTCCRRDEIGSLRRSEIHDLDKPGKAYLDLPGERTKNGRRHIVPLCAEAVAILKTVPHRVGRDLLFGEGKGGFSGWSKAKEALDNASGVTGWKLHWIRHTGDTRMHDNGVLPHIVEAVLNHVSGHRKGVAGTYNHAEYLPEKRAALDTLASYIKTTLAKADGANVTKLRARKR